MLKRFEHAQGAVGDPVRTATVVNGDAEAAALDELRVALQRSPPEVPCKYFYDDRGSALFEQITRLPEYYPTRTERALLLEQARPIVEAAGPRRRSAARAVPGRHDRQRRGPRRDPPAAAGAQPPCAGGPAAPGSEPGDRPRRHPRGLQRPGRRDRRVQPQHPAEREYPGGQRFRSAEVRALRALPGGTAEDRDVAGGARAAGDRPGADRRPADAGALAGHPDRDFPPVHARAGAPSTRGIRLLPGSLVRVARRAVRPGSRARPGRAPRPLAQKKIDFFPGGRRRLPK